jgi:hypothetical protein
MDFPEILRGLAKEDKSCGRALLHVQHTCKALVQARFNYLTSLPKFQGKKFSFYDDT